MGITNSHPYIIVRFNSICDYLEETPLFMIYGIIIVEISLKAEANFLNYFF